MTVQNVLVGVDAETDEVPRALCDVLHVVAKYFHTEADQFTPALIRYYLAAAATSESLARRLGKLSKSRLATGKLEESLRLRIRRDLHDSVGRIASSTEGVNMSDLVRGAILAAKQDVLDGRGRARKRKLEAVAQAV